MGLRHARGYAGLERAGVGSGRLVVVCDADPERAARAAAAFAALTGRTLRAAPALGEVLADSEVDAVDVVLPTAAHHPVVLTALRARKHVLVEKPFGLTIRACEKMRSEAERAGLVLAVAENYRRVPTNRALRGAVEEGVIGKPRLVAVHVVQPAPADHHAWHGDPMVGGSLPLLELAVHEADLLRVLFGEVEEVHCTTAGFDAHEKSEDAACAVLRFSDGTLGQLAVLSAGRAGEHGGRVVAGSSGTLVSARWEGWERGSVIADGATAVPSEEWVRAWLARLTPERRQTLLPDRTWDPDLLEVDIQDPLRYGIATELHDFVAAVAASRRPEVGAEEGTAAVAICLAMLESAAARSTIAVGDVLSGRVHRWQAEVDRGLGLG